jgi:transcriptional regulator with XRE-family HTH domain
MKARALVAWNLRRIRVEREIAQERLAFDAGVDRAYVGGLERQTANPTIDLLEKLADSLRVPLSEFFVMPVKGAAAPKPLPAGRKGPAKRRRKKQ